ncbi:MAG: potassium-transporting ATPase subunit C, partial [Parachlamydia sp.]|nr:potassium-transporting ATPase subunit C [Parachlamydia sp.]
KNPDAGENIPEDLLFASASGLDPHISQAAAYYQLGRVAQARKWNADQVELARRMIDKLVEHNPRVFPGEAGVNVLLLNLGIDQL